ncbi:hypothetical protein BBO01nite_18560 [Brevibacillus borstelensis]|nr:hypothetical protein BBO01nite_18560 [Brevibacillus borstelensis]
MQQVGVLIMIQPLRKLLPEGTFRARRGMPATIGSSGLFVACYHVTESNVALGLLTGILLGLSLRLLFVLLSFAISFHIKQR